MTEETFIETTGGGRRVSPGRYMLPTMPRRDYGALSGRGLKALFAYLAAVGPVVNAAPRPVAPPKKKSRENR